MWMVVRTRAAGELYKPGLIQRPQCRPTQICRHGKAHGQIVKHESVRVGIAGRIWTRRESGYAAVVIAPAQPPSAGAGLLTIGRRRVQGVGEDRRTPYADDSDYIFASSRRMGTQPYWMSRIMQHYIKPAAAEKGIRIKGWHMLRHSYTTLLWQNNNNPKVVQGLLRHASITITMNIYDEAMSEEKRNAHRGVIQQLNRSVTRSAPKLPVPQVVDKIGVPDGI